MRSIFGCPENFRDSLITPAATFPNFFHGLLFTSSIDPVDVPTKFQVRSFNRFAENKGNQNIWAVFEYDHAPFSPQTAMLNFNRDHSILRICAKTRDGERPSQEWRRTCGRPSTTWVHQICRNTGVSATEALLLAEDKPFWRTIATAGGSG